MARDQPGTISTTYNPGDAGITAWGDLLSEFYNDFIKGDGSPYLPSDFGLHWQNYTVALTATSTNPTLGSGAVSRGVFAETDEFVAWYWVIRFGTGFTGGSGLWVFNCPVAVDTTATGLGATSELLGFGGLARNSTLADEFHPAGSYRKVTWHTKDSGGSTLLGVVPEMHNDDYQFVVGNAATALTAGADTDIAGCTNLVLNVYQPGLRYDMVGMCPWFAGPATNPVTTTTNSATATSLPVASRSNFPQSGNFDVVVNGFHTTVTAGQGTGAGTFTVSPSVTWVTGQDVALANPGTIMYLKIKEGSTEIAQMASTVKASGTLLSGDNATARVEWVLDNPSVGQHTYKMSAFCTNAATVGYSGAFNQIPLFRAAQVSDPPGSLFLSNSWPWPWDGSWQLQGPEVWGFCMARKA